MLPKKGGVIMEEILFSLAAVGVLFIIRLFLPFVAFYIHDHLDY